MVGMVLCGQAGTGLDRKVLMVEDRQRGERGRWKENSLRHVDNNTRRVQTDEAVLCLVMLTV